MNELIVVRADYFKETGNQQTFDTHGKPNIILIPICGKIPNQAMVLAGSVAINGGFLNTDGTFSNQLMLVNVVEKAADETYGRQFNVILLDPNVSPKDLVGLRRELGEGTVVDTKPAATAPAEGNTPALSTATSTVRQPAGGGGKEVKNP